MCGVWPTWPLTRDTGGWLGGWLGALIPCQSTVHAHTHKHTQHMRNGTHAPTDNVHAVCCPRHPAARICVALCLPAAAISASAVSALRKKTGAGMMDCKKALSECSGDEDKAVEV